MKRDARALVEFLKEIGECDGGAQSIAISEMTSDSRKVARGSVFFAIRGTRDDGHRFVDQALASGAALCIGEEEFRDSRYVRVKNSRRALAWASAWFFGFPSREMEVWGVTGTSGKTTTAWLLQSILFAMGKRAALFGTIETRFEEMRFEALNTTPDPIFFQRRLREFRDRGCDAVALEVSSHALDQYRVDGTAFDGAIFTNLSPEHLDYHRTIEEYFEAKRMFFTRVLEESRATGKKPIAAIHSGDRWGQRLIQELSARKNVQVASFSIGGHSDYALEDYHAGRVGFSGRIRGVNIESSLIGRFNAENVAGAIALALARGASVQQVEQGVRMLRSVPGRLEPVERGDRADGASIDVRVDYAHKPDAVEKVLLLARELVPRGSRERVITVFGCGGDRDRAKRPIMGAMACRHSDVVYVTSDNPRTEEPNSIIAEIRSGCDGSERVVEDRRQAIAQAIQEARPGDLVLILGKGHEDYQIVADVVSPGGVKKLPFDDREAAREALKAQSNRVIKP